MPIVLSFWGCYCCLFTKLWSSIWWLYSSLTKSASRETFLFWSARQNTKAMKDLCNVYLIISVLRFLLKTSFKILFIFLKRKVYRSIESTFLVLGLRRLYFDFPNKSNVCKFLNSQQVCNAVRSWHNFEKCFTLSMPHVPRSFLF